MSPSELDQIPYARRQNIVVVSDEVAEELKSVAPVDSDDGSVLDRLPWRKKPDTEEEPLPEHLSRWVKARQQMQAQGFELRFVSDTQSTELDFESPGHPVRDVVYVGHPLVPDKYYPAAFFHRELLEHRYCELFSLLMHLGATEIRVEVHGAKEKGMQLSIPLLGGGANVDGGKSSENSTVWTATLNGSEPKLPDELLWFRFEKTWQTIAEARMSFGLKDFDLAIDQKEDFGVTGSFEGVVSGLRLKLGGRYTDVSSVSLRLSGKFAS